MSSRQFTQKAASSQAASSETPTFAELKAKHREIRDSHPSEHGLRIHRALSWLQRAEQEPNDDDAAYLFYWIAFNAAYAREINDESFSGERTLIDTYFGRLTELDRASRIYNALWERFPGSIRLLLNNKFVFQPFWKHHHGAQDGRDWEVSFQRSQKWVNRALATRDTRAVLNTVFDRLYVLRNQIVHGGATWESSVNRDQVRDSRQIIATLVPLAIDVMMDHPEVDWGTPYYPVVD